MAGFCLPELNYCVCGGSLRTGALIIAWIEILGSLDGLRDLATEKPSKFEADKDWTDVLAEIISLLISGSLFIGVHRKTPGFFWPYIVDEFIFLVYNVISVPLNLLFDHDYKAGMEEFKRIRKDEEISKDYLNAAQDYFREDSTASTIAHVIGIPVSLYFLLVVRSYYNLLKRKNVTMGQMVGDELVSLPISYISDHQIPLVCDPLLAEVVTDAVSLNNAHEQDNSPAILVLVASSPYPVNADNATPKTGL